MIANAQVEPADELERIAHRIKALAEAALGNGRPYYISALGIDLGQDLEKLKSLTKRTLADFIRQKMSDKYEIIRFGPYDNILALVRPGQGEASLESLKAHSDERPKLHYRFWAAFSVPPTGSVRYLNMDDLTFADLGNESAPPDNALAISSAFIPAADAENRDDQIWSGIHAWLADNKLSLERFLASKPSKLPRFGRAGGTLLESIVAALDKRQLQNTSLSLDVVATLLQTRS